MRYQRVTYASPTKEAARETATYRSAVPGVGARNGARETASTKKAGRQHRASRPALASHHVALIDRSGLVRGVFDGHSAMRLHLQGGAQ